MRRFVLVLLLLLPFAAWAQDNDANDPYALLASDSFEDVTRGIDLLAQSGDPHAGAIIGAITTGDLYVAQDNTLYIHTDAGYVNARTGAPAPDVTDDSVSNVRTNNAVRRAAEAATGSLDLFSPDPGKRAAAADALFKSHDPASLPALDRALAAEKQGAVRRVLTQARAAALLASTDASEADRLAAVAALRARGDADARGQLASLVNEPPEVARAAAVALAAIDRSAQLWSVAQDVLYGLSLGSVLLLAAAGLAITFGVMGVINMAHGEMVMLGAYTTFVVQQTMHQYLPNLFGGSLLIAVPAAFLVSGAVGIAIEQGLIRFLYGRPLETLLATWGLSLVLQQAVRSIFGPTNQAVSTPEWMSGAAQWGGLTITYNRLTIILFAFAVIAALTACLRATPLGLRMRAVTQNRRMAAAMGIRTPLVDALTFGLGSGIAGMAGVALSQIDNVSPNLGQSYIIDSFMVVVFGGVGNLWGTVVSALTLGILNKFLEPVAGAVLGKIVVLVLLIAFIQRKPRGLFPLKGRAVEA
ncbi:MAG: urea ABC transporter permease subunit UrtB [Acidisphaera sp.]|nr:urea ABC transporter permease subunit UrtB [Acidisphaera sp.]MBV9813176.1 urea ABC transporter permease subunit UrtB [Acetobacteraceae bacterium]